MTDAPVSILKKARLKVTPARLAILGLFPSSPTGASGSCGPLDAEGIFKLLRRSKANIVTIYRTLSTLEKAGVLKKVDIRKDSAFYELAEGHHHHIVCADCGKIEDFELCGIESVAQKALKRSSFRSISAHSLELTGLCKRCAPLR